MVMKGDCGNKCCYNNGCSSKYIGGKSRDCNIMLEEVATEVTVVATAAAATTVTAMETVIKTAMVVTMTEVAWTAVISEALVAIVEAAQVGYMVAAGVVAVAVVVTVLLQQFQCNVMDNIFWNDCSL